jgi:hypothetical protein
MVTHAPHPIIFVLAHPATCCLSQRFIFHTHNPPFTTGGLNTFIQVNIMDARYTMHNWHIYRSQLFFLCFYMVPGQAMQLAPNFHVGNSYYWDQLNWHDMVDKLYPLPHFIKPRFRSRHAALIMTSLRHKRGLYSHSPVSRYLLLISNWWRIRFLVSDWWMAAKGWGGGGFDRDHWLKTYKMDRDLTLKRTKSGMLR